MPCCWDESVEEVYELVDPWFLDKMQQLLETEKFLKRTPLIDKEQMHAVKSGALVIGRLLCDQDQRRYSPGVPASWV